VDKAIIERAVHPAGKCCIARPDPASYRQASGGRKGFAVRESRGL